MSWTLASEGMEGLPESRVAWREGEREREKYVICIHDKMYAQIWCVYVHKHL